MSAENARVEITPKELITLALQNFTTIFNKNHRADRQKANRWWKERAQYLSAIQLPKNNIFYISTRSTVGVGRKRVHIKTLAGRGRKRADWVEYLHSEVFAEFERLRELGVKFSNEVLRAIAVSKLCESDSVYRSDHIDLRSGKEIPDVVTYDWVRSFMNRLNIVIRKQSGTLMRSLEQITYTQKCVAFHLGKLSRDFDAGALDDSKIDNMDETHFVVNRDNGFTLGFKGDSKVNYTDVVSGGQKMTLVLRISGGVESKIESVMLTFCNKNRIYPISGVLDILANVSYRSHPSGWMGNDTFINWIQEPSAVQNGRTTFLDNCSGHRECPLVIDASNVLGITFRKLPANETHLCQPLDSFVIQKFKQEWKIKWDKNKLRLISNNLYTSGASSSGKLVNPGKPYFPQLINDVMNSVNSMLTQDNLSYANKAMIMCGLSKDIDGTWNVGQLSKNLQDIVFLHQ